MKIALVSLPVQDPITAHEIYTSKLGFKSKRFEKEAKIAIVESAENLNGTAILLEPCQGNFLENYQKSAFESNLPIMAFEVADAKAELKRLSENGVKLRPDLEKPEWEIVNVFEDGCGNLLMMEEVRE